MNQHIIQAFRAKMVVGKIYKTTKVKYLQQNVDGILLNVIFDNKIRDKNAIGIFKYDEIKYSFVLPIKGDQFIVNIPSNI